MKKNVGEFKPHFPNFSNKVKSILKSKRLKVSELAEHLGISRQGLHYHLSSNSPNYPIIFKIAQFLDVEPEDLFDDENERREMYYARINLNEWEIFAKMVDGDQAKQSNRNKDAWAIEKILADQIELTNKFAKQNQLLEEIVKYYVKRYIKDPVSSYISISGNIGIIGLTKNQETLGEIKKIIEKQSK